MAALDFPNAPTVGQVYNATNGVAYKWDGTLWALSGPATGQPAGGDLTGTYPNPTIKPTSLPWTPSGATLTPTDPTKQVAIPGPTGAVDTSQLVLGTSGMTGKGRVLKIPTLDWMGISHNAWYNGTAWQRDDTTKPGWVISVGGTSLFNTYISAAGVLSNPLSIDATGKTNCTLANASVTAPMMAVGGSVRNQWYAAGTASWTNATAGWFFVASVAINTAGGLCLVVWNSGIGYAPPASNTSIYLGLGIDMTSPGTGGQWITVPNYLAAQASPGNVPLGGLSGYTRPAAGAHTITGNFYMAGGIAVTQGNPGSIWVIEFA